jgi:hypothetical protein
MSCLILKRVQTPKLQCVVWENSRKALCVPTSIRQQL